MLEDLSKIMNDSGFKNWNSIEGSLKEGIYINTECHTKYNRKDRIKSEPGVGWITIYNTNKNEEINSICNEVYLYIFRLIISFQK